ncbi:MAG: hypothetical protein OEX02_18955, partial [Cyclobacteriaceae bacterium]|nr:hypothetical protein [Cyclobacteriaceae bacterium]
KHISNLRVFDAAVVYQGEVNPQWVRMKVLDLLKAPGYGRQKTVQGRALIGRNNKTFETYTERGLTLIEDDNNMMKSLEAFLEDIK